MTALENQESASWHSSQPRGEILLWKRNEEIVTSHTTSCCVWSPAGAASPRSVPPGDVSEPPNRAGAQLGMSLGKVQPALGLAALVWWQHFQAGTPGMRRSCPALPSVGTAALPARQEGAWCPLQHRVIPWEMGLPDWGALEKGTLGNALRMAPRAVPRPQLHWGRWVLPSSQCQVQLWGRLCCRTG